MASTTAIPTNTSTAQDDDEREIEEMRQQVLRMEQELLNAESGGAPSTETKLTATASPATAPASTPTAVSMGTPATTSGANLVIFNSVTEGTVHMDTSESGEHGGGDEDPDARSIYVGNVDYGATPEEIQAHFSACGTINRVTILLDKFTGHPKGYAYVEFASPAFVDAAMVLNESLFRGRLIKVVPKRTNIPGFNIRGRGRGRGRGRHPYGYNPYARPRGRGRGRGF